VFTKEHGHLTAGGIAEITGQPDGHTDVFVCGPAAMLRDLSAGLRHMGLRQSTIHAAIYSLR
jgi:ferredoxin-NADP reductase